jgi:hypothetical protein
MQPANLVAEIEAAIGYSKRSRYKPSDADRRYPQNRQRMIPDLTFQEALERTGRHLNISIAPASSRLAQRHYFAQRVHPRSRSPRPRCPASTPRDAGRKDHLGEKQAYLPAESGSTARSDDMPAKRLARLRRQPLRRQLTNPHVIPCHRQAAAGHHRRLEAMPAPRRAGLVNAGATTLEKPCP